jgi:hypothetical protein
MSINGRLSAAELKAYIARALREAELLEKAALASDFPPEGIAAFRACAELLRDSARKAMESLGEDESTG